MIPYVLKSNGHFLLEFLPKIKCLFYPTFSALSREDRKREWGGVFMSFLRALIWSERKQPWPVFELRSSIAFSIVISVLPATPLFYFPNYSGFWKVYIKCSCASSKTIELLTNTTSLIKYWFSESEISTYLYPICVCVRLCFAGLGQWNSLPARYAVGNLF